MIEGEEIMNKMKLGKILVYKKKRNPTVFTFGRCFHSLSIKHLFLDLNVFKTELMMYVIRTDK